MPRSLNLAIRYQIFPTRTTLACTLMAAALCAGCGKDSAVVWTAKSVAPSGDKIAVAETTQYGGPGTAGVFTTVDIVRPDSEGEPVHILVLENPSAANISAIELTFTWKDDNHLDISYPADAKLNFRADLYGNVEITSRPR